MKPITLIAALFAAIPIAVATGTPDAKLEAIPALPGAPKPEKLIPTDFGPVPRLVRAEQPAPAKAQTLDEQFKTLDPDVWGTRLRPGSLVGLVKNGVAVKNRAYLLTKQDFTGPIEIEAKVAWVDNGGGRAYADVTLVTWKSSGKVAGGTDELQDGLQVRLVWGDGFVQVQENGSNRSARSEVVELVKDPKKAAWPAGTYTLRIKDEGKGKVNVTVAEGDKKPFTEITTDKLEPTPLAGKKVVLGNRNRTAEFDMQTRYESVIINKSLIPKKD